ncbi:hypothetical protein HZP43_13385 [Elizabethkingia anophelis]|jgi:hypothetical protein|nr:hypothetical protein [Elizabethkingia anophelis]
MNEIIQYVKFWLIKNRPELKSNDINALSLVIYKEIKSEIENLEEGARVIYIQEFLNLNYLKSAYNLIKDVFQEYFSKEFSNYQKTPIFYEINDDILRICVAENIFMNKYQLISPLQYFNNDYRKRISEVIVQSI